MIREFLVLSGSFCHKYHIVRQEPLIREPYPCRHFGLTVTSSSVNPKTEHAVARVVLFFCRISEIVEERQHNIHGSRKTELHAPKYAVLCNAEGFEDGKAGSILELPEDLGEVPDDIRKCVISKKQHQT